MILEKIHSISNDKTQKMLFYGLAVLLFLLPVPQIFQPGSGLGIEIQAFLLTLVMFYFGFFILTEYINKRFSFMKKGLGVKCIAGLILVAFVSVLTAYDKTAAIYGTTYREEGIFSLMAYYSIFVGTTFLQKENYRRKLFYLFLLLGVIVIALGVLQYTGLYRFNNEFPGMAHVPMRNPNFYGGFTVMFTGVSMGSFYSYKKDSNITCPFSWWNRVIWYVLVLIGYTGCICARSVLVYAGLIMMLLMYLFLVLMTKRKELLSFVLLVAGLLLMIWVFDMQKKGGVMSEIKTVGNQIKAEGSITGDSVGSGRMRIWKGTISFLPEYGLLGCGIECLGHVWIEKIGISADNTYVDKAHNEYLNLWVTEGFFALVIYLVFLFSLFIPGMQLFLKKKDTKEGEERIISKIAFFAFFGYIAQAFFSISVIQVAPYFWMICGLLYCRKGSSDEETVGS